MTDQNNATGAANVAPTSESKVTWAELVAAHSDWSQAKVEPNISAFLVDAKETVPNTSSRSSEYATDEVRSVYERLERAWSEEAKQAIIAEELHKNPDKREVIWDYRKVVAAMYQEADKKVDAFLKEFPDKDQVPAEWVTDDTNTEEFTTDQKPEEFTADETYEYDEWEAETLWAEYVSLKEYKAENELKERALLKHKEQLEEELIKANEELNKYKFNSITIEDKNEESFVSSYRDYKKEKNDSTKYYYLYSLNNLLEREWISIKWDIDTLYNRSWNINRPQVIKQNNPYTSKDAVANMKKFMI